MALTRKRRRSALETFDGCPYRFDVLYNRCQCGCGIDRHDQDGRCQACGCRQFQSIEDRGDESLRGIAFHECAFRYIDRLAKAETPSDAEEASLAFQEGIALSQVPFHLVDHVARLWARFVGWFQLDLQAYYAAEQRLESDRFTWIPDLVYVRPQGVEIIDWKTFYKGLTEAQAMKEFQLKFYLIHALQLWPGFPTYTFTFNFVRLGYQVSIRLTPDQIEAFRDEVEAIDLAMTEAARTETYPAIPGSHCTLCRLKCPLVDNPNRLPVRLVNLDQAQQAFGRILVLEQELKALKKSLGGWCHQEGPLVYRGQEYAHRSSVTRTYPAATVITWLMERGADVAKIMLSKTSLGDYANPKRAQPAVTMFLEQHEQRKTRWAFRHSKAGADHPQGLTDVLAEGDDDDGDGEDGG